MLKYLVPVLVVFGFACNSNKTSDIKIDNIFGDNMVLQRGSEIRIAGKASPGTKIYAGFNGIRSSGRALRDSSWSVVIPSMEAGGPYKLMIEAHDTLIAFSNIMLGDVWIASGQSNMVWKLGWGVENGTEVIAGADYPEIRFFTTETDYSSEPLREVGQGEWLVCNPDTAASFSAVAYFFAREIHESKNIPIGMVVSAIGGTTIKGWIADKMIAQDKENIDTAAIYPDYDDSNWELVHLPAFVEEFDDPDYDGYSWFRKELIIDDTTSNLTIHLGRIDDADVTWFNGTRIGKTKSYNKLREYEIDKTFINKGRNVIVVRVLDGSGLGGFWGAPENMYIETTSGEKIAELSGEWKFNNQIKPQFPVDEFVPALPGVMFNGMVAPFTINPVKGIIWYQGEADAAIAGLYQQKMNDLIFSWRREWNNDNLPFLFVQLPNFLPKTDSLVQLSSQWAQLREAQRNTLQISNTGMAVTIDVGEADNVHPAKKMEVGHRLALQALKIAYGDSVVSSGPLYESFEMKGDTLILTFTGTGSGLIFRNGEPKGVALRGLETAYLTPHIALKNHQLIIFHPEIKNPVEVRYNWADNPDGNLYNKEGLPAAPFKVEF